MHLILIDVKRGRKRVIREDEDGTNTSYGRISRELAEKYVGSYIPNTFLAVSPLSLREAAYQPKKFRYATQIIYPEDRGTIITFADIRPNKVVLEAGTGSGFLASYITRHAGFLYTYEVREEHYKRAVKNLRALARPGSRKAFNADVREFKSLNVSVDAIVLDMPSPREVLEHIHETLKPGGRICVLVPTYNQVEKVYLKLLELGFIDIFARESIVRDLSLKPGAIRPVHRGITFRIFTIFGRRIYGSSSRAGFEDDKGDK